MAMVPTNGGMPSHPPKDETHLEQLVVGTVVTTVVGFAVTAFLHAVFGK
jgi:hypothetical protein